MNTTDEVVEPVENMGSQAGESQMRHPLREFVSYDPKTNPPRRAIRYVAINPKDPNYLRAVAVRTDLDRSNDPAPPSRDVGGMAARLIIEDPHGSPAFRPARPRDALTCGPASFPGANEEWLAARGISPKEVAAVVRAPGQLTLLTPALQVRPLRIDGRSPMRIDWSPGDAEVLVVRFDWTEHQERRGIECTFDAARGFAEVPEAILAGLPEAVVHVSMFALRSDVVAIDDGASAVWTMEVMSSLPALDLAGAAMDTALILHR